MTRVMASATDLVVIAEARNARVDAVGSRMRVRGGGGGGGGGGAVRPNKISYISKGGTHSGRLTMAEKAQTSLP